MAIAFLAVLVVLVVALVAVGTAWRRAAVSLKNGEPTPEEKRVHVKHLLERQEAQRAKQPTPEELSNEQLEQEANDRSSLVPPRK